MRLSLVASSLLSLAACGGSEDSCTIDTSYDPVIDPARFATTIDHPLFPLTPGATFVYEGGGERIEVEVTTDREMILGISAVVVRDTASIDGEVIEDTFDWYAQDLDGNVWYLGEDTQELENGQVTSTEGSWRAGVNGAKPGIIMPAVPIVGQPFRQEYAACEAEDMGEVVATNQPVTVPAGSFTGCLQTLDTSLLDPDLQEHKFYCPGVGLALIVDLGSGVREELIQKAP